MKKMLNGLFFVIKFLLLIASFSLTLFIILTMYKRIDKDIVEALPIFIPYIVLLLLFFINVSLKQKNVNENLFFNLTCSLVFSTICLVGARAIFDENMILNEIMGYHINFAYFSDFISFMKIMLYGLIVGDICFMFHEKNDKIENTNQIEVL